MFLGLPTGSWQFKISSSVIALLCGQEQSWALDDEQVEYLGLAGGELGGAAPAPTDRFCGLQLDPSSSRGPYCLGRCHTLC